MLLLDMKLYIQQLWVQMVKHSSKLWMRSSIALMLHKRSKLSRASQTLESMTITTMFKMTEIRGTVSPPRDEEVRLWQPGSAAAQRTLSGSCSGSGRRGPPETRPCERFYKTLENSKFR